ncbi:N-acetyltransferase B complex non catalytic subunit-domain-containing protein [Xylariaceae sp. FL0804]|nr:N-acetyltransferase B complex non catalytic subunit-domain-containing protein [Xylariaceae sp. FL0804]
MDSKENERLEVLTAFVGPLPLRRSLRISIDTQLQYNWENGKYAQVIPTVRQRYKASNDPYYLAVEHAARSQLDTAADREAGKLAVEEMVKDGIVIRDVDMLDLYEFACAESDMVYSDNIGALRVRFVKANAKNKESCVRCFDACLRNCDWLNAQQIAASLDSNFAQERKYLFWNIVLLHVISFSSQYPLSKRQQLYARLAKGQVDKAWKLTLTSTGPSNRPLRAIQTEAEQMLWMEIRFIQDFSAQARLDLLSSSGSEPLDFVRHGFLAAYRIGFTELRRFEAWDKIWAIGYHILDQVWTAAKKTDSRVAQAEKDFDEVLKAESRQFEAHEIREKRDKVLSEVRAQARSEQTYEDRNYRLVCCDWYMWRSLVDAAQHRPESKKELKKLGQLVDKLLRALARTDDLVEPIFTKNRAMLDLAILFVRAEGHTDGTDANLTRVTRLMKHIGQYAEDESMFDDLKEFIGQLNVTETASLLKSLKTAAAEAENRLKGVLLHSLRLKVRLLWATSDGKGREAKCSLCNEEVKGTNGPDCASCLRSIAIDALARFSEAIQDEQFVKEQCAPAQEDPLSSLTMVGAVCLLKLSKVGPGSRSTENNSTLSKADVQLFLQAVVWVDFYVKLCPKNDPLRLLLIKLYLLMGCVSHATELWRSLDAKNILHNSLASLLFDRCSSFAPADFGLGHGRTDLSQVLAFFTKAVRRTFPDSVQAAFHAESYSSVIDNIDLVHNYSMSCTLVMAVVESRRQIRMMSGRNPQAIDEEPLIKNLSLDTELQDKTDYKYSPNFLGPGSEPMQEVVGIGPLPTSVRSHLGVLSECFVDLVSYVQPKDGKPAKTTKESHPDWKYAIGTCDDLLEAFERTCPPTWHKILSRPESRYYRIVHMLVEFVKFFVDGSIATPSTDEARKSIVVILQEITKTTEDQTSEFLKLPDNLPFTMRTFHSIAAMHAMGMLCETASIVKNTVQYAVDALEKLSEGDKARGSKESVWVTPELDKLLAKATKAQEEMKKRVAMLEEHMSASNWMDRIASWTFESGSEFNLGSSSIPVDEFRDAMAEGLAAAVPDAAKEDWTSGVAESWRELTRGWKRLPMMR